MVLKKSFQLQIQSMISGEFDPLISTCACLLRSPLPCVLSLRASRYDVCKLIKSLQPPFTSSAFP